jgi:mRNA interferase MazF
MNPRPGEVWLADLGLAAKSRPVIVVSRYDSDPPRSLVLYVPLTTRNRKSRYEVVLPKLITVMNQLKKALSFALELSDKA